MELSDIGRCESNCENDGSVDGRIARSLFRTEWDDTSSTSSEVGGIEHGTANASSMRTETEASREYEDKHSICCYSSSKEIHPRSTVESGAEDAFGTTTRIQQFMHVHIESKSAGASIAEMLWPAASYLAEFLLHRCVVASDRQKADDLVVEESRERFSSPSPMPPNNKHRSDKHEMIAMLDKLLRIPGLSIVELGAGVGLTGLELATQLPCQVLLTDLPLGLDLLRRNVNLNRELFALGKENSVHVQKLEWGNEADALRAIQWCEEQESSRPILIIGSDCVYWEELHGPLESTMFSLLSRSPRGSLCVLAGMRRWKRDNSFYQALGKRSRTATHELRCTCVQETITRSDAGRREVMRVYVARIVARGQITKRHQCA